MEATKVQNNLAGRKFVYDGDEMPDHKGKTFVVVRPLSRANEYQPVIWLLNREGSGLGMTVGQDELLITLRRARELQANRRSRLQKELASVLIGMEFEEQKTIWGKPFPGETPPKDCIGLVPSQVTAISMDCYHITCTYRAMYETDTYFSFLEVLRYLEGEQIEDVKSNADYQLPKSD